jgi:predicted permease
VKRALRHLFQSPGFTVFALATLALGIGVNTTAFTVLNRLLLQSLPFRDADRLVQVWASNPHQAFMAQSPGDFIDIREHNTSFEGAAAYYPGWGASLAEPGQAPIRCGSTRVSAGFFEMIGVQPQMGRLFTRDEENRSDTLALVSNSFWREHYGADPKILGRLARLDGKTYTIVGVMPPSMDEPTLWNVRPGFWPLDSIDENKSYRAGSWYRVAARLKPGVTLQAAQAEMTALAGKLAHDFPKTNAVRGFKVVPFPRNSMGPTGAQLTWMVMALSGAVLLIACVNLANLQLVRTTRRTQEIGVRLALGCPRSRLIGMLLAESLIVSAAGGALALLVAKWSNAYVAHYFDLDMPLDLRVLAFTFAAALATGAMFGTVPAWMASRTDVVSSLNAGGRGATSGRSRHWLRQALVIVELCLALTLLSGAGFFVTGIHRLTHRELGWSPDNELVGFLELDHDHYGEMKDPRSLAFGERLRPALKAVPGVQAVAFGIDSPAWGLRGSPFRIEGQPAPEQSKETYAGSTSCTPGYLALYGIPIVEGRDFTDADRPGSRSVVIVSESMAKKFWPGESPIGKRLGGTDPAAPNWAEVVGVMKDFSGAEDFYDPTTGRYKFLRPWAQNNNRFIGFHIKTAGDAGAMMEPVRKAFGVLAPDFALSELETVKDVLAGEVSYFTFLRRLLLQISVLGLLLAGIGIYGVVANLTSERTKEIGIRAALGAEPGSIVWLFLGNGIRLALAGAALGLAASLILVHVLSRMLPLFPGSDPKVVAFVTVLLFAIALLACWLPARRTTRVSPMVALRAE